MNGPDSPCQKEHLQMQSSPQKLKRGFLLWERAWSRALCTPYSLEPVTTKAVHALRSFKSILSVGRPPTQLKLCRMKMSAGFASAVSLFNTLRPSALPRYYDLIRQSAEIQQAPQWLLCHPHHADGQWEAQGGRALATTAEWGTQEPRLPISSPVVLRSWWSKFSHP